MLSHEPLELRDELVVTPESQIGLDALLDRREPQLLQPRRPVLGESLVREVAERRAAPQRERRSQELGCRRRVIVVERSATLVDEPLEAQGVDALGVDRERVSAA